ACPVQIHPRRVGRRQRDALLPPAGQRLTGLVPGHLPAGVDQPPPRGVAAVAGHHHADHPGAAAPGHRADGLGDHPVRAGPAGRDASHRVQHRLHVVLRHLTHLPMISHEMTDTPAPAEPYVCPHCEETHAHEHVDSRAVVLAHRRRLAVVSAARIVLVLLAVVGVLLWLPATADLARQGGQGQAAGAGSRRLVTVAVLTGAALTPVAALLVALAGRALVDGTGPGAAAMVATAAGTGWLTASAAADVVRALRLRSL